MTHREGRRRQHRRHKARTALRWSRPCVWLDRHPPRVDVRRLRRDMAQEFVNVFAQTVLGPLSMRDGCRMAMRAGVELVAKATIRAHVLPLLGLLTIGDSNARGRR